MIETLLEVRNLSKTFRYRTGWFRRQTVEAVKPLSRHIDACDQATEKINRKRGVIEAVGTDCRARGASCRTEQEARAPSVGLHKPAQGRGCNHRAKDDHRDWQGGKA